MDAKEFDALVRALTQHPSRRGLAALLGGLTLGGSLGSRLETARAKKGKRGKKKPCPPCKKRKQGKCKGTQPDGTGCTDTSGRGGTCQSGSCVATVLPPPPPPPPPGGQCRNFRESCTANAQCCGAETGTVACREHVNNASKAACRSQFPGQRCCGLQTVLCNPNNGNCDCCDDLICTLAPGGQFRCQIEP